MTADLLWPRQSVWPRPLTPAGAHALTASIEGAPALSFLNLLGNRAPSIGEAPFLDLS